MENYEDYLKQVADLGGANNTLNSFLEIFLRTEYGEGYTYEGDLQNNLPHGQGVLYYPNKQVYAIGEWGKGRLQGFSKIYDDDGKLWQEGNFVNGKLEGEGILHWKDLPIYEKGTFKDGFMEGKGLLFLNNQLKCEGTFKLGVLKEGIIYDVRPDNEFITNAKAEGIFDTYIPETKTYVGKGSISYRFMVSHSEETNYEYEGIIECPLIGYASRKNSKGKTYKNGVLTEDGIFGEHGELLEGKRYYDSGELKSEGKYTYIKERCQSELWYGTTYYPNGQVHKKGTFDVKTVCINRVYDLLCRGEIYSKEGLLISDGEYTLDEYGVSEILHGEGSKYDEYTGECIESGIFENGKMKK